LRVIAGDKKGRRLLSPEGLETRPTTDKVKEALFSIIQFDLPGASFLDLFAGSGQIGIEALSRGAERAVFVDSGKKACSVIKENLTAVEYIRKSEIHQKNVEDYLSICSEKFDIVFMDPPYDADLICPIFDKIVSACKDDAIIICEIPLDEELFEEMNGFELRRRYRYGKTELVLFRKKETETEIY